MKHTTIKEVEVNLPSVKRLLQEIQDLHRTLNLLDDVEIEATDEDYDVLRSITKFNKAFHRLSYEFFKKIDMIECMGGIVKDIDEGLIDFFCKFEDREVFLCWKQGEDDLLHWHELDDNYENRKKILDLHTRFIKKEI